MFRFLVKHIFLMVAMSAPVVSMAQQSSARLKNEALELSWKKSTNGYVLQTLKTKANANWNNIDIAKYQHNILYSATKPETSAQKLYDNVGREILFPDPQYRYIIASWQQNTTPAVLNTAGENIVYNPSEVIQKSESEIQFRYENDLMQIQEKWSLDAQYENDIRLTIVLHAKKAGYYSLPTPSLISADKYNFKWATVPGIFQGNAINDDFVRAFAYGQGIPNRPMVTRERTATTLTSILTDAQGVTVAVTAEPGTGRDPWENDKKTHAEWRLGLSAMNREGELSPTLYHPVLGQAKSYVDAGDSISFSFRYTIQKTDWYTVLKHVVYDVYKFTDYLDIKETKLSLTQRLYKMHTYLTNDSTSKWNIQDYKGLSIGAQDYLGGVYDSEKDAMKNSDYGAMWMLAKMTNDSRLTKQRLPYAINFKLKQQHEEKDFFHGAAAGQYYLYKSKKFAEEWGPYTEPIATTYYMLMDMGNILLFEPNNKELKQNLRNSADRLLAWMHPNGQWEVGYNNQTTEPVFTDIKDLRPTFYGMMIAYQILKEEKYLRAAIKGADWYVENAVNKGHFLGVCGDTRFVPDFATVQSIQALLELYDITKDDRYKEAAVFTAKIYTTSIYTHPIPTKETKQVKGIARADWEISQVGLNFEHGGIIGSANHRGPILLASHAGLFARMYSITNDSLFLDMARVGVIARDAFVDTKTGVASYYWDSMNDGAGPFPHHAWWQVGWITDYLLSEVALRTNGEITFPRGFITPKVGPHQTYGFAPGNIWGAKANLIMRQDLFEINNPNIEYVMAHDEKRKTLFIILLNNDNKKQNSNANIDNSKLFSDKKIQIKNAFLVNHLGQEIAKQDGTNWDLDIEPYGLSVLKIEYK